LSNVYFLVFVVAVPAHPLALAAISSFVFGWGMVAHLGYELYPRRFSRGRAFRWINSATHHNMHHSHGACNYGLFFNLWDRALGTNHPAYRATFDADPRLRVGAQALDQPLVGELEPPRSLARAEDRLPEGAVRVGRVRELAPRLRSVGREHQG